jgi:hypothetical protein
MDGVWGTSNMTIALNDHGARTFNGSPTAREYRSEQHTAGRWPTNVIHDGSPEALRHFPDSDGSPAGPITRNKTHGYTANANIKSHKSQHAGVGYGDAGGSAARFCFMRQSQQKRTAGLETPNRQTIDLLRWLVRLVTPPGGLVLDPFDGRGSTGEATLLEGFAIC